MRMRKKCDLENLYGNTHPIHIQSPELVFMQAVCAGDAEKALLLFREYKQFVHEESAVDTPYGRFEGLDGIQEFVSNWLPRFEAQRSSINPVIQTVANGRVALEAVIEFVVDGEINQVPMLIIADFRGNGLLDEVRLYCHFSYVPHLQAYRKPIFKSAYQELADPLLLTGAIREYYIALHHYPSVDVDRIMACISPDCIFGGYARKDTSSPSITTGENVRKAYEFMKTYIPRCVAMRFETIIDDGHTCVIEWVHLISKAGQEEMGRIAMSGVSAYERNDDGLISSIRIIDYAYCENTIEWDKVSTPKKEALTYNLIDIFPSYIGTKSLE